MGKHTQSKQRWDKPSAFNDHVPWRVGQRGRIVHGETE